jgi:hypothetical protein
VIGFVDLVDTVVRCAGQKQVALDGLAPMQSAERPFLAPGLRCSQTGLVLVVVLMAWGVAMSSPAVTVAVAPA